MNQNQTESDEAEIALLKQQITYQDETIQRVETIITRFNEDKQTLTMALQQAQQVK